MKKNENSKENSKKVTKNNKKRKIWKKILLAIVVLIIVGVGICAGLLIGMSSKYAITKEDLIINLSNSIVVDSEGQQIAVLSRNRKQKNIK